MAEAGNVLFVQNRTRRAGAQTCLARLLQDRTIRQWNPAVVCSPGGWLVEQCARLGVPVIEQEFPRSRSLAGRLFGNAAFAKRVAAKLAARSIRPAIVHANDHQEGLLGLRIAARAGARTAMILRSPAMTQDDYRKYRCAGYGFVSAVGEEIRDRAQMWDRGREVALVHDGLLPEEFAPPRGKAARAPVKLLVLGSPLAWKGWADMTAALAILEGEGRLPPLEADFTGSEPDAGENDLKLGRLRATRCNFLGRTDAFRDLVQRYELVVHPSRMETFGMAAMETVAAGVPLISSRTGVLGQVLAPHLLFSPSRPDELASALGRVLLDWSGTDFDLGRAQERIRARFMVDKAAAKLDAAYRRLLGR